MSSHPTEAQPATAAAPAATPIQIDPTTGRLVEAVAPAASGASPADAPASDDDDSALGRRIARLSAGVWFCGGLLSLYTLYIGRNLFVPVAVALFAYLTLRPIVRGATKVGVPPALAATTVMLSLSLMLGILFYLVAGPAQEMLKNAPQSMSVAREKLAFIFDRLERVNEATEEIAEETGESESLVDKEPVPVQIKQSTWTTTSPILAGTGNVLSLISIAFALLYFLMVAGDDLLRNLTSTIPTFSSKRRFVEVIENVQDALSSYLGWVTLINTCLGIVIGLAMWLLQMPSPVLWGVAAMLLNFLPIVGAIIGISAAFFIALVNFEHVSSAFLVAGTYFVLTSLEGQFITPSILGKSMRLSSAVVFLFIVIWGWMWGIAGIFLAVPILLTLVMISEKLELLSPVSTVIGGSPPEPPKSSKTSAA